VPSRLLLSSRKVRVPAGGNAKVAVTLVVKAARVGSSLTGEPLGFSAVSGNVTLTSAGGTLRVPYLLVPRAQANVNGAVAGPRGWSANAKGSTPSELNVKLANPAGALAAVADFYTWGLSDGRDVSKAFGGSGYDLRAAGVQSFDMTDGKFIVFAVNNYDRWSSPASQEFDIAVDTNNDGAPEYVVYSFDSGASAGGDFNGIPQVFIYDMATGQTATDGYGPVAPTDSSTILVPVNSASIGLGADSGAFAYTVASYTAEDGAAFDEFSSWASYDPWAKAVSDGAYEEVARNGRVSVPVAIDPANFATQKPKGVMVVVFDNKSGPNEALLFTLR
jgi:minor extracellular serine protease Vpr